MAHALLAKATGDEAGLRALADNTDVPDHVAGFLAQQAIEKSLKAVLTARGLHYERSHDIDYLCGLIEDNGLELTERIKAAVALTPWAVEFRYAEPLEPNPLDRNKALATVSAVREWANQTISEKRPTAASDS
ncbi:MAG: HEPN domain-containing protein [Solirubrobacteraceae bacterium]